MRTSQTDAERKIWSILRGRNLSGFKFRRQHPVEGYILDFYCVSHRLAVELDGGQHCDPQARRYDEARTMRLKELEINVLRFWDDEVLKFSDAVADEILRQILLRPSPQPSPGVPGEGVKMVVSR
jgi:very-short-patch-repair endonuclease